MLFSRLCNYNYCKRFIGKEEKDEDCNSSDSFKGTLTSLEAARAIEQGIKRANPSLETVLLPVADGGEGTMETLVIATSGHYVKTTVLDPLDEK
ncbi:hypothetical protein UACE39S_05179 [Ureibacillus acetophenoni]